MKIVNKTSKAVTYAAVMAGLFSLVGCGSGNSPAATTTTSNVKDYDVDLKGSQVLPTNAVVGATSASNSMATLHLDTVSGKLTGTLMPMAVSDIKAVHLHNGFAGQDGSVVKGLTLATGSTDYMLDTTLTAADMETFKAGGMYLNIHSGDGGNTQVRGQVLPPELTVYRANLIAANNVTTNATAVAAVTIDEATGKYTAYMTVRNLSNVYKSSHVHNATAPVITFAPVSTSASNVYSATGTLSADNIQSLKNGALYVNVHTEAYPASEITGILTKD